jgi:asparagine synthase (glutamine-hydrolysing)
MCGILAYFNKDGISGHQLDQSLRSLKKIKHRGPDGEGVTLINTKTGEFRNLITDETPPGNYPNSIRADQANEFNFDLFFGHRRLSIIDISINGHQPMYYENGNWIIFNGEIYNYIELRDELKISGFKFKTSSDTEVIHAAYQHWGPDCLKRFNGMFALVLFDNTKKCIFTANDRFGVKPLYYKQDEKSILFISELKQAHAYGVKFTLKAEQVENFFDNYTDYNDHTIVNEIKKHKPSNYTLTELSGNLLLNFHTYYEVSAMNTSFRNPEDITEEFKRLLTDAVKLRLRSDVPVGFASSGGLDSSSILYIAHHLLGGVSQAPKISTFSAIFPGMPGDESEFIKVVEKDLEVNSHYVNPIEKFSIKDFEDHIYHQDFPVLSTSFYAGWCESRLVKESGVKVLLVGQGADEILGGYHHHFYRYCRQLILTGKILKYISLVKKHSELKNISPDKLHKIIISEVKLALKLKQE